MQIFYKNNSEHVYFKTKRFGRISPFLMVKNFQKKKKKQVAFSKI